MKAIRGAILAVGVLIGCGLLIEGCTKSSTGSPGSREFTVTVHADDFSGRTFWVVLHDPTTQAPFAVKQVTSADQVGFGDVGRDRVSVTFVDKRRDAHTNQDILETFSNVPVAHWDYTPWPIPQLESGDTAGQVDLSVNFPPEIPRDCSYEYLLSDADNVIGSAYTFAADSLPSVLQETLHDVGTDAQGRFGALAFLEGDCGQFAGWTLGQPYRPDRINHYSMSMSQRGDARAITASRPLGFLSVEASIGDRAHTFRVSPHPWADTAQTVFRVFNAPDFPATEYQLYGFRVENEEQYEVVQWVRSLPSSVTIPDNTVTASCDSAFRRIENISVTGSADRLRLYWTPSPTTTTNLFWVMSMDPSTRSATYPSLPDSIWSAIDYDTRGLVARMIEMDDYDPVQGYDQLMSRLRTGQTDWTGIDRMYSYARSFNVPSLQTPRRQPWPTSRAR